jgi:hypothetical protein
LEEGNKLEDLNRLEERRPEGQGGLLSPECIFSGSTLNLLDCVIFFLE